MNNRVTWMAFPALLLACATVQASMRCDDGIISEGALIAEVLAKCGEPDTREVVRPNVEDDGYVVRGSAQVEYWQYGPDQGMYRTLRFIDGRLVEIRSRRY